MGWVQQSRRLAEKAGLPSYGDRQAMVEDLTARIERGDVEVMEIVELLIDFQGFTLSPADLQHSVEILSKGYESELRGSEERLRAIVSKGDQLTHADFAEIEHVSLSSTKNRGKIMALKRVREALEGTLRIRYAKVDMAVEHDDCPEVLEA